MILIDSRAGSKGLVQYPPLNDPNLATLCTLDSADVAFYGNTTRGKASVGIEVKSLLDLIGSLNTKRLQVSQIPKMLSEYNVSILLYYGLYRPCLKSGNLQTPKWKNRKMVWSDYHLGSRTVPFGWLESALLQIRLLGIQVVLVPWIKEEGVRIMAHLIGCMYRNLQKDPSEHKLFRDFDTTKELSEAEYKRLKNPKTASLPLPIEDKAHYQRASLAAQLPGIRFERAMKVADHFESPLAMALASEEEWKNVPGVGKVIAGAVHRAWRDRSSGIESSAGCRTTRKSGRKNPAQGS